MQSLEINTKKVNFQNGGKLCVQKNFTQLYLQGVQLEISKNGTLVE
jgi:hypothetical protein